MGQLSDGEREAGSFNHLQRWGSVTSTTSSNDWNDIGLPPLPRQRSLSAPADASPQQQQDQLLAYASLPFPEQYMLQQQHSLPLEAMVYEAAVRQQHGGSPRSCALSAPDAMLEGDSQVWDTLSPAAFATAAAIARARRCHQALHSSSSMSSTSSGSSSSSFGQGLGHAHSGRSERSVSYTGHPVAMDVCSSGSARSLPCLDSLRCQDSPKHADLQHAQAKLSPQELVMLTKLRAILSEKEQLSSIEKQLRHKLEAEASKASSGSPRAAAQAAAARSAFLQQHQRSACARSPQARALHQPAPVGSPATSPAGGSPCSHSSSTAAALLAAGVDPALVVEYVRAHKQQQQQHQACAAAVAAAAAAASSPRAPHAGHKHARKQGLGPVAMAKLRQLMALQQQQIQVQQVGFGWVLCCAGIKLCAGSLALCCAGIKLCAGSFVRAGFMCGQVTGSLLCSGRLVPQLCALAAQPNSAGQQSCAQLGTCCLVTSQCGLGCSPDPCLPACRCCCHDFTGAAVPAVRTETE